MVLITGLPVQSSYLPHHSLGLATPHMTAGMPSVKALACWIMLALQATGIHSSDKVCPTATNGLQSKTIEAKRMDVDFKNTSPENVELVWVSFTGDENRITVIGAGESTSEVTNAGHAYRVKTMQGVLLGEYTIPGTETGQLTIPIEMCVESAGQGSCPEGDSTCNDQSKTSEEKQKKEETPEQKAKRELREKKAKEKAERRKRDNEKKQARLKEEAEKRAAKQKIEDADLAKRKAQAKKKRDKEEAEAAKCPVVFDAKGKVVKFGKNTVGKGKCRHRSADKLTRKERREQQLKKMEYTDKLGSDTSSNEKGAVKNRHKMRMAKRRYHRKTPPPSFVNSM